ESLSLKLDQNVFNLNDYIISTLTPHAISLATKLFTQNTNFKSKKYFKDMDLSFQEQKHEIENINIALMKLPPDHLKTVKRNVDRRVKKAKKQL
ncbi:MAG: hypothetical protein MHPSP_004099, partial [Paramarteilia canceri]